MLTRTWPHGTRKDVEVIAVEAGGPFRVVACVELSGDREGFILINSPGAGECIVGDAGTITFAEGGPTGGHWRFETWSPKGGV
jgi:hypothetical protein